MAKVHIHRNKFSKSVVYMMATIPKYHQHRVCVRMTSTQVLFKAVFFFIFWICCCANIILCHFIFINQQKFKWSCDLLWPNLYKYPRMQQIYPEMVFAKCWLVEFDHVIMCIALWECCQAAIVEGVNASWTHYILQTTIKCSCNWC